jgi:hypothetical protein
MKFFEAQKRAAFAVKLFSHVGFDLDAALAANDETALKTHLATLPGADFTTLFANAGLDVKTLLAAGPDSLKAHFESLDTSAELTEALAANEKLTADLAAAQSALTAAQTTLGHYADIAQAIGLPPLATDLSPDQAKAAFAAHVGRAVTLANAKIGHPAPVAAAFDDTQPKRDPKAVGDSAHLDEYIRLGQVEAAAQEKGDDKALAAATSARRAYGTTHHEAINRAVASRGR